MKVSMHALFIYLLLFPGVFVLAAPEISVHRSDAIEGEDFEITKPSPAERPFGVLRTNGEAQISGRFRQKVMEAAGVAPFFHIPTSGGGNYYEYVQTRNIYQTTNRHVDIYVDKEEPMDDQAMVAFFMLNTNDDAYFSHGETCLPIKKGNLVTFPGNVAHHTIINSGSVHLVGPFDVLSSGKVGEGPGPTPEGTPAPIAPPATSKSTKAPSIKSTKAPSIKSTKAPSIKSTKAPSIKSMVRKLAEEYEEMVDTSGS